MYSVRIDDQNEQHTRVSVFNRGALAGQLTVLTSDAGELIRRITDEADEFLGGNGASNENDAPQNIDAPSQRGSKGGWIEDHVVKSKAGKVYTYKRRRYWGPDGRKHWGEYLGKVSE